MKGERELALAAAGEEIVYLDEGNLTETDKFARELFSTVAALNQSGEIDETTVEELTTSLALEIQTPVQRKVFTMADLKITSDNSTASYQKYSTDTDKIFIGKYPFDEKVIDILQRFSESGEDGSPTILAELDPVIKNLITMVEGMATVKVPAEIATNHLDVTNGLQKILENLEDFRNFEKDPIRTFGAASALPGSLAELDQSILAELRAIQSNMEQ